MVTAYGYRGLKHDGRNDMTGRSLWLHACTHAHTHVHTPVLSYKRRCVAVRTPPHRLFSCLHFWPLINITVTHSRLCWRYPRIRTETVVAVASHHEVLSALWEFYTKEEVGAESYYWLSIHSLLCCRWRGFIHYEHTRVITPILLSGHLKYQTLTHQPYTSSHSHTHRVCFPNTTLLPATKFTVVALLRVINIV